MKKICLLSTGQPSTNPRLVKEADALSEAGYAVHVIGSYFASWAVATDKALVAGRKWTYETAGGAPGTGTLKYYCTRARHKAARVLASAWPAAASLQEAALGRTTAELTRAARAHKADLYIAHYLPALAAAANAAEKNGAKLGFDAEDFHSGQLSADPGAPLALWTRSVEKRYIGRCAYITASSPAIAEAYRTLCALKTSPAVVLNVFPMSMRPQAPLRNAASEGLKLFWFSQSVGEQRGLEDAVRAIGRVKSERVELHLLGKFMPGYRQRLFALAAAEGVAEGRIIAHDILPPDELVRFSSQWDIALALETARDQNNDMALSNKIFTYLLAGNAVIASATTAQSRLAVELGQACRLFRPGDVEGLAAAIRAWDKDRVSLQAARDAARRSAESVFNWDLEKKKLVDAVRRVL